MREIIYVDIDDMDVEFFSWGAEVKYFTPDCNKEYRLVFEVNYLKKEDRKRWNDDLSNSFSLRFQRHAILKDNIQKMFDGLFQNGEKDNETDVKFFRVPKYVNIEECKKDIKNPFYSVHYVSNKGFNISGVGKEYNAIIELIYDGFFAEHIFVFDWSDVVKVCENAKQATIHLFHREKQEKVFIGTIKDFEVWI